MLLSVVKVMEEFKRIHTGPSNSGWFLKGKIQLVWGCVNSSAIELKKYVLFKRVLIQLDWKTRGETPLKTVYDKKQFVKQGSWSWTCSHSKPSNILCDFLSFPSPPSQSLLSNVPSYKQPDTLTVPDDGGRGGGRYLMELQSHQRLQVSGETAPPQADARSVCFQSALVMNKIINSQFPLCGPAS